MSRAYNAGRKARRQARAAAERKPSRQRTISHRRFATLLPVFLVVAILAVVGVLGFGTGAGVTKKQVEKEVAELLDGIPQKGAVLGSPKAPLTVWVYADLECPTVKLFVEKYLPALIDRWVRPGTAKIEYRSLQTDSTDEAAFFEQERAALAAGRQGRMWNFALTFLREQGEAGTGYVTEEFITGIASQVPGLQFARWRSDRRDAALSRNVARDVQSGHALNLYATPALIHVVSDVRYEGSAGLVDPAAARKELASDLRKAMESLGDEAFGDRPTLGAL